MNRSGLEIAETGLDDLYSVQNAFNNIHAIFTLMLETFPEDGTAHAFAQLGIAEVNEWSTKVFQWSECMDNELDVLRVQNLGYPVGGGQ
jgi:hypothetical protein